MGALVAISGGDGGGGGGGGGGDVTPHHLCRVAEGVCVRRHNLKVHIGAGVEERKQRRPRRRWPEFGVVASDDGAFHCDHATSLVHHGTFNAQNGSPVVAPLVKVQLRVMLHERQADGGAVVGHDSDIARKMSVLIVRAGCCCDQAQQGNEAVVSRHSCDQAQQTRLGTIETTTTTVGVICDSELFAWLIGRQRLSRNRYFSLSRERRMKRPGHNDFLIGLSYNRRAHVGDEDCLSLSRNSLGGFCVTHGLIFQSEAGHGAVGVHCHEPQLAGVRERDI